MPQTVGVVAVRISQGNLVEPLPHLLAAVMLDFAGIALIGARFLPGGRLISTAAAGRYGLPLRRFLPWSLASSLAWSLYMLAVGLLLGPLTGGSPLLSLVAGAVMAALTAGLFAVARRVRGRRPAPATRMVPVPLASVA